MAPVGARFFGRAKAEDRKLIKELALEVPYLEGTLQKLDVRVPESKPRGRGQFLGVII
jgi:hypothetical protein